MYTPPRKTHASLRARQIFLVWNACAQNNYKRLLLEWNARAKKGTRVCVACEARVPKTLGVWNTFTQRAKRVAPACHTRLLYTLRLVGTVVTIHTWYNNLRATFRPVYLVKTTFYDLCGQRPPAFYDRNSMQGSLCTKKSLCWGTTCWTWPLTTRFCMNRTIYV